MADSTNAAGMDASMSSLNSVDNDTSATSSANVDSQASKWTSTSTPLTASPLASRETSPTRSTVRPARLSRSSTSGPRSRKNSIHDRSSSKSRSSISNPSTTPRQPLSSTTTPTLLPPSRTEPTLSAPVPQKPPLVLETSRETPRWPISPRLKSPPPYLNKPAVGPSTRRNDNEPPSINLQRATPVPQVDGASQPVSDNEVDDPHLRPGTRTPARGPSSGSSALETVQEVSQPNSPPPGLEAAIEKLQETAAAQASPQDGSTEKNAYKTTKKEQSSQNGESGSDSGSVKMGTRRSSAQAPPLLHSRQSSTALKFGNRGQTTGESSSRNMTVETEEVKNMQKISLVPNVGAQGGNTSLRTKASNETIKPKKEKKKHSRKPAAVASGTGETPCFFATTNPRQSRSARSISSAPCRSPVKSLGQGSLVDEAPMSPLLRPPAPGRSHSRTANITAHMTNLLTGGHRAASSKADIFEAKVASAVEEANSSDSEETFVYDSNPPDVSERPRRFHSRTPSAASMVSQADRSGMRSIHSVLETGAPNVPVKKSMKFVNTFNNSVADNPLGDDDSRGTGWSNAGSGRGTGRHHHPGGRWGRNNPNHLSLFDNESPFQNAPRSKISGNNSRQFSNPPSPRFATNRGWMSHHKRQAQLSSGYDMDETTGADDESTPLMSSGTVRSARSGRGRRTPLFNRNVEAQTYQRRPSFLNRFASCLVLTIMLLLVTTGAIGFMFATSQPLTDIKLVKISNVLASEQELMLDISVKAHNPNVVVVMVDSADLEIFAKSPHAGTDSDWWRHPDGDFPDDLRILDDPIDDPPNDDVTSPNMRLGSILEFDSPLSYEGSFFQSGISVSTGSLRLSMPGNDTTSGSKRWERIISDDFTLIIKGVLKYTLPLSQRVRSASIDGKTTVKPNSANNPTLPSNGTEVGIV
ncbi:hypothetical protein DL767_002246 [Monosporascus sp. MG133]|nr:hypothetical protein DL767_002246 [Monosporascus sp. MG133]